MIIGGRFGHTGKIVYQYGHAFYHFRLIGTRVYRFGVFTHWIDGRREITRERVG